MRALRSITLSLGALCLATTAGCGGTDQQPEMPDPSVVDRSADDLGLPQEEAEAAGAEGTAGAEEAAEEDEPPPAPVRVVAGERAPLEGDAPAVRITAPRDGQRIARGRVDLRLAVRNWPLEPEPGRHVHVIVDDEPYIAVRDVSRPIDLTELVRQHLGHDLAQGTHVVRVFPSRGHHESVKAEGAFGVVVFHYGAPTAGFSFDASAPLLTYSRPKGCNVAGDRVLLDFYVSNVELARDGHRVRYEIDGRGGVITSWAPHWIENLSAGEHTIRLTLLNAAGEPVPGPFNDTTRTITVAASCP